MHFMPAFLTLTRLARPALLLALLLASVTLAAPLPAGAHASLIGSEPPANSVVRRLGARVTLWFDDPLEAGLAQVTVTDAAGNAADTGDVVLAPSRLQLSVGVRPDLPDGLYTVGYRIVSSSDGHTIRGFLVFTLGPPGAGGSGGAAVSNPWEQMPAWPETAALWAAILGSVYAVGFVVMARRSALLLSHSDAERSALLTRALAAGRTAALAALGVVALAALAALAARTLALGEGPGAALLVAQSRFGVVWISRALLALALARTLQTLAPPPLERTERSGLTLALLGAGLLWTFPELGHAAAAAEALGSPAPMLLDFLHLGAAAVWLGGLLTLAVMAGPLAGSPAGRTLLAALAGVTATPMVLSAGVLAVTGLYAAGLQAPQPNELEASPYGAFLLAKLLAVALFLVAAAVAVQSLRAGRDARPGALRGAGALAVLVLALAATLVSAPPPRETSAAGLTLPADAITLGERQLFLAGPAAAPAPAASTLAIEEGAAPAVQDFLQVGVKIGALRNGASLVQVDVRDREGRPDRLVQRITVGSGMLGSDLGWSSAVASPALPGRYLARVQWFSTDGRWPVVVTVRRQGQQDDLLANFGMRVAGAVRSPGAYGLSSQPFATSKGAAPDFYGLVEFFQDGDGSDMLLTLTGPKGELINGARNIQVTGQPTGMAKERFVDRPGAPAGDGRFLARNVYPDVYGDWTITVKVDGLTPETLFGYFIFSVLPDGSVSSPTGQFPPGHH